MVRNVDFEHDRLQVLLNVATGYVYYCETVIGAHENMFLRVVETTKAPRNVEKMRQSLLTSTRKRKK